MFRTKRLLVPTLLSLALLLSFVPRAPGQLTTLRVGMLPIVSTMPLYATVEKGFSTAEGLKLDFKPMRGGAVILPAVAGGSLEVGMSAYMSVIISRTRGFDFTIIAPQNRERYYTTASGREGISAIMVREDSGIRRPEDLKGKTIAVNTFSNINQIYAYEWLSRHGVEPKKGVNWIEIGFPRMGPALRNRQVDAISQTEPFITVEKERGGVRSIGWPYQEVSPDKPLEISGYVVTEAWLAKNRNLVERFVRAYYKGMDYVLAHPKEWAGFLRKYTRVKPRLIPKIKIWDWHHPLDVSSIQRQVDLTYKWGVIKTKVDAAKLIHSTALR